MFGAPRQKLAFFDIVHFKHTHTGNPKTLLVACLVQRYAGWGATPKSRRFKIVHFKHTHTRYQKTLLVACLAQRCACLGRHAKNAHFLALCISNTPILGIQKHCWLHVWCRGMRVWGATPKAHIVWHCAFPTHPYWVSKNSAGCMFGAEVCGCGAPR